MIPLVGLSFGGRVATEHLPPAGDAGVLGRPVWGPEGLLRDLELRLGLARSVSDEVVRVQRWGRALGEHAAACSHVFFARSLATDPLGTAAALLAWRDELVISGWNGTCVPNGGARLDALAAVEALARMPLGSADRVRRVERALELEGTRVYEALELAEPGAAWPGRWQAVFARLEALGTHVSHAPPLGVLPQPDSSRLTAPTDLARVQGALAGREVGALEGDGSFVVLQAETSWELADCAAALLRASNNTTALVIRCGDGGALDLALASHHLPTQGCSEHSTWRGPLQLLSLGVQLLFAPRDVFRVLDLVTLPGGPFDNMAGNQLAKALCDAPGVGGREWLRRKDKIVEYTRAAVQERVLAEGATEAEASKAADVAVARQLETIAQWIEGALHDAVLGAPKAALLETVDRVRELLRLRIAAAQSAGDEELSSVLGSAFAAAERMFASVSHDPRSTFDREAALQLVGDATGGGARVTLTREHASRVEIAECPGGARRPHGLVLWWHAVAGAEWRPGLRPWRSSELLALDAAGVRLAGREEQLAAEAESWRAPVLAATERLVLCVPRSTTEGATEAHPIWTEINAALRADDATLRRVAVTPAQLRGVEPPCAAAIALLGGAGALRLDAEAAGPSALPPARTTWRIDGALLASSEPLSAGQIEALVACPLRWVLDKRVKLAERSVASIPGGPLLLGKLAHRLVEGLHELRALGDRDATERELATLLPRLVEEEAAPLLRPGKAFERAENDREMRRSLSALSELLERSSLRVAGVETELDAEWLGRKLDGRIDMLLLDPKGDEVVLDLKWGASTYRALLEKGVSIQLAVYAASRSLRAGGAGVPHAAYFSLKKGKLLATERGPYADAWPLRGPTIRQTWDRLTETVKLAQSLLGRGEIAATGVRCVRDKSNPRLPLLDAGEVPVAERDRYLPLEEEHGCKYCNFGTLCGKRWEELE